MCLLECLCTCRHFGCAVCMSPCSCLVSLQIIAVIFQTATKNIFSHFLKGLVMFNTPCCFFQRRELLIATIASVSVLLLLTTYTRLNCLGAENGKMTQHFCKSVCTIGSTVGEEQYVCLSLILQCYSSVTAARMKMGPIKFRQARLEELGGGDGSSYRVFFNNPLSHVLSAPCAAIASLSSSVAGDAVSTESTPSATASKYDPHMLSDSFMNDK